MQEYRYLVCLLIAVFCKLYQTSTTFPILIVISFDGFRYDYIDKVPTPAFHSLLEKGVRAKWMKNVFVTKTFPNHFSIATGLYEETHGIVGNGMYDPETQEEFDNKTMFEEHWWNNNFSTPIWIANQLASKDRHSGCVFWSGIEVPYFNQIPRYSIPFNLNMSWTERIDKSFSWLTTETDPANLLLYYFEEPDMTGHKFGPDSKEVEEKIVEADNILAYMIEKLKEVKLFEKTNIIVLSDHGMANVTEIIDIDKIVHPSLYRFYGHSPVWNLLPSAGEEENVYSKLKEASETHHFSVYKRKDIPEEYHYKHHRRILPIVIEANEGFGLVNSKHRPNSTFWGDHGYNNSVKTMHPIFVAHGPAFKVKYLSEPFMNLDVYPLMCHILGIDTPKNNGTWENIRHILKPTYPNIRYLAYSSIAFSILLALVFIGGAFNTASNYKPTYSKIRYTQVLYLPEEKENLLSSEN